MQMGMPSWPTLVAPGRRRTSQSAVAVAVALVVGLACPVGAQTADGVQGLQFGLLFPGTTTIVTPETAGQRAEWQISGVGTFTVQLVLPIAMTSTRGDELPLQFTVTDGVLVSLQGKQVTFDPRQMQTIRHNKRETTRIWLGGSVIASPDQRADSYSATVTLIVSGPPA